MKTGRMVSFLETKMNSGLWTRHAAISRRTAAIIMKILRYGIIFSLAFVFIYPVLFMVSQAFMTGPDIADGTVQWIPKRWSLANYIYAVGHLGRGYFHHIGNSTVMSLSSALVQIIGCSLAGYGFARYRFPGQTIWMGLLLFTFLVPLQALVVPLYMFFHTVLKWQDTYLPFVVPGLFGHGLRGSLFVLVFIQFFRGLPHELEEAARIDGAGAIRTFLSIMIPLARPAILVVFLFSIVWHWNDTFLPDLYLKSTEKYTLNQTLGIMKTYLESEGEENSEAIGALPTMHQQLMAGAVMTVLPLLILYLFTQKYFVESVARTGIAGD